VTFAFILVIRLGVGEAERMPICTSGAQGFFPPFTLEGVPRISLVIPAFNEEAYLPALLDSIDDARRSYSYGTGEIEVVVADNSSTDCTAEIASSRGCLVASVAKPSIAASRNGGAGIASGTILAFVDADCTIHPDTFNAIERTMATGQAVVGATGARFSRSSFAIALTMFVGETIARLFGFDIGVVFCRRDDWAAIGGYNEQLLCAEDVEFIAALKEVGRKRGQRFARAKGAKAITSARKFDSRGDWHYFTMAPPAAFYAIMFDRGSLHRIIGAAKIEEYWYDVRKTTVPPTGGSQR
jgi:glycosyltransferase involved in cell wall biosynthesis